MFWLHLNNYNYTIVPETSGRQIVIVFHWITNYKFSPIILFLPSPGGPGRCGRKTLRPQLRALPWQDRCEEIYWAGWDSREPTSGLTTDTEGVSDHQMIRSPDQAECQDYFYYTLQGLHITQWCSRGGIVWDFIILNLIH